MLVVWTISDLIGIALFGLIVIIGVIAWVFELIKQSFCKHKSYFENSACNAICHHCGKNLGFIGYIRGKK